MEDNEINELSFKLAGLEQVLMENGVTEEEISSVKVSIFMKYIENFSDSNGVLPEDKEVEMLNKYYSWATRKYAAKMGRMYEDNE